NEWSLGGASKWWLHQSLKALAKSLEKLGAKLLLRCGDALNELQSLVRETEAIAIFWNRRYEPFAIEQEKKIGKHFQRAAIESQSFNSHLLFDPWEIENKSGKPFRVFTPFWKTCLASAQKITQPIPAPKKILTSKRWPKSLCLEELELEPKLDWAKGFSEVWEPGETGAQKNLKRFVRDVISDYENSRNRPDQIGTSRLSPHLHFGEISPRHVWAAIHKHKSSSAIKYLAEIGWREFAHHLLFHFPNTPTEPLQEKFRKFAWRKNPAWLKAWQRGQTGYPIVDAGMRELWTSGWMHNRVRMIVASFLVKDLLLPWQSGARWFWDTLVDADLANNTLGWQWSAGCGADAAPFFRIFNPIMQGEKFDPQGDYVRRWIPEIANLPDKWIQQPWNAPSEILSKAGVELGKNYPKPIVSHTIAREVALEAFQKIKS
ncbi:MAG: deoxyribodipyrimidine photo-lyase, partial [Verrucomicrobiota bacterium]